MNDIIKLNPFYSEKVWGYEKWNLSTHKNGHCTISNTEDKLVNVLGEELSILIKIIKSNETLSVQVHPDDEYAKLHENDSGKTECWYILEAEENATLICGIKQGINKKQLSDIINCGCIEEYLNKINVKSGDMIYIPSGTVHAIEGGLKLIEIQQSSDITYRIYDWERDREVHIKKSLDVIDYEGKNKGGKIENFYRLETPYFNVEKVIVNGEYEDKSNNKFHAYTVISGNGYIYNENCKINLCTEETVYIKDNVRYNIVGNLELLKSYI